MKKLILLIAAVAMLLPSCKKINEELDSLGNRIDKLENETIPSIDEQIAAINVSLDNLNAMDIELKGYIDGLTATATNLQEQINTTNKKIDEVKAELKGDISSTETELKGEIETAKANVIAQLEAAKEELENELAQINATIATLQAKDAELDQKIASLRTYVDTELGKTTDWVNATFATLEQYNALVSEIATIKEQIKAINESITNLETKLTTKINEDIATAVSTLNADIQQKVSEITTAYTNAVKTAREEITAAYTVAIQTAINVLDASLKAWVSEQLANYYTIAEIDALLAALELEMNGKLEAQKAYLEGLINELSTSLTKSIADNKVLIDGLQKDITTIQGAVAEHASRIAQNASSIATNTQNIIDLSKAIYTNKDNISANEKAIADNKALIEANAKLIADNKNAIEALKNSTSTSITANATAIAKNAEDIAQNGALISANAIAINNNAAAIADNAADILQLQQNLTTTKTEITEAYQKAINDAITTNNGVIDTKIAAQVQTINTRIDNEVATINSKIATLTSRIAAVENEIATIQQQIAAILEDIDDIKEDIAKLLARIQSVSYIPTYDDGKATVKYNGSTSRVTLDFEVSPKDAVVELAKVWQSAVSVKAIYTQTRAVSFIDMPIVKFESDAVNGVISVTASGENLSAEFFNGTQSASARLSISDGNNSVVSEYVPMIAKEYYVQDELGCPPSNEIWYKGADGIIAFEIGWMNYTDTKDIFGANFVSNTYKNGKGVLAFDGPITKITDEAFQYPYSENHPLLCISLPSTITEIERGVFQHCNNLVGFYGDLSSEDNMCLVVNGVLCACANSDEEINTYTIPDNVTTINSYVFHSNIKCITLHNNVTSISINPRVFSCNTRLDINILDLSAWCNMQFIGRSTAGLLLNGGTILLNGQPLENITIPNNVTSINDYIFSSCSDLTSVTMGNNIRSIGESAFNGCSKLTNITMSENITSIGASAFEGCSSLSTITIPDSVTTIGNSAFDKCSSLTSIAIPESVTSIGSYAFNRCSGLLSIYCKPTTPPSIYYYCSSSGSESGSFPFNSGMKIFVPRSSYDDYMQYSSSDSTTSQNNWYRYESYIEPYDFE